MTGPETTPRRGRRARALSPEEQAAREARASEPGVRGAVAPPTADEPVPTLRKFGRRARIIELSEQPAPSAAEPVPAAEDSSASTIGWDHDGVELGELSVTEAPEPRPAPRFEGKVLHRTESGSGRALQWLVWALIAIALVVLIVLLLTGVLGPDTAAALPADLTAHPLVPSPDHPLLEDPAA